MLTEEKINQIQWKSAILRFWISTAAEDGNYIFLAPLVLDLYKKEVLIVKKYEAHGPSGLVHNYCHRKECPKLVF